jgi:hypothetical protein
MVSGVQPLPATPVLGASVPMVQPQPIVTSTLPAQTTQGSHIGTYSNPVPDDDYRLGRGILDDFRPSAYKSNVVGSTLTTTGLGGTTTTLGVTNTGLAVSTPGTVGASNIKDFL